MKIAVFDFDGTLYPYETLPFLCKQLKKQSRISYYRIMTSLVFLYLIYKMKIISGEAIRKKALFIFINSFRGYTREEIDDFFREAYELMKKDFNPQVVKEAESLRNQGYTLALVSGACKPLVHYVGEGLGFHLVIGTEMPVKEGKFTGEGEVTYISGENKASALLEALSPEKINFEDSYAFADSYSDIAILEMVGNPVAVNPEKELFQVASQKNWRILGNPK